MVAFTGISHGEHGNVSISLKLSIEKPVWTLCAMVLFFLHIQNVYTLIGVVKCVHKFMLIKIKTSFCLTQMSHIRSLYVDEQSMDNGVYRLSERAVEYSSI